MVRLCDVVAYMLTTYLRGDDGVEAVEYALFGAMLVAIVLAINPQFSGGIAGAYTTISNAISSAVN
jgi:Flp pilus assembly pilin Flp